MRRFFFIIPGVLSFLLSSALLRADEREFSLQLQQKLEEAKKSGTEVTLDPAQKATLVQMVQKGLAQEFGTTTDSREMTEFAKAANDAIHERSDTATAAPKRATGNLPVLKHLRFKEGIAFPSAEALQTLEDNTIKKTEEIVASQREDFKDPTLEIFAEQQAHYKPIPKPVCLEDLTERLETDDFPALESAPYKDFLFYQGDLPFDPATTVGSRVIAVKYTTEDNDLISAAYGRMGIPCLPFRARNLGKVVFFHTGAKAFINFDRDPLGEGQLDPTVEAYLKQQREGR